MLQRYIHELAGLARSTDIKTVASFLRATLLDAPTIVKSRNLAASDKRIRGEITFRTWREPVTVDCMALDRKLAFDPSSSFGLAREIYGRNVYLRPFRKFSAAGKVAMDFGGNRGLVTALMAAAIEPDTILYVEPDARYLSTMRDLTARYSKTAVSVQHGFIGASPTKDAPLDVDAIAPRGPIAFVKMDIEGAEEALFANAGPWLDRVERVAMESHPEWCSVVNVVQALKNRGFTVLATNAMGRNTDVAKAMFIYAARDPSAFT